MQAAQLWQQSSDNRVSHQGKSVHQRVCGAHVAGVHNRLAPRVSVDNANDIRSKYMYIYIYAYKYIHTHKHIYISIYVYIM